MIQIDNKINPFERYCPMVDCRANDKELCLALDDTYFNDRLCPFYKTKQQYEAEQRAAGSRKQRH